VILAAALLALAQQPADQDERVLRRARIEGWTIEEVAESDGGLLVRMVRSGTGYRIEHVAEYWRGNSGPVGSTGLEMGECVGSVAAPAAGVREVGRRLRAFLAECGVGGSRAARVLSGLDGAYLRFAAWSSHARRAVRAEAEAIANEGRDPPPRAARRTRRR
jgi:hypothetical protein